MKCSKYHVTFTSFSEFSVALGVDKSMIPNVNSVSQAYERGKVA